MSDEKIAIENINAPGKTVRVDRAKYLAMPSLALRRVAVAQTLPVAGDVAANVQDHLR